MTAIKTAFEIIKELDEFTIFDHIPNFITLKVFDKLHYFGTTIKDPTTLVEFSDNDHINLLDWSDDWYHSYDGTQFLDFANKYKISVFDIIKGSDKYEVSKYFPQLIHTKNWSFGISIDTGKLKEIHLTWALHTSDFKKYWYKNYSGIKFLEFAEKFAEVIEYDDE